MWCRRAGIGALEGVERLADAAVAEAVHVHLEAQPVELADEAAQRLRVDEGEAGVGRRVAAAVEVGLDQRSGAVLGDAVLHDLDRGRARTARRTSPRAWRRGPATCSSPRSRSHHSAPTTALTRSPRAAARAYVGPTSRMPAYAPTIASCQLVTPSECRWRWPSSSAAYISSSSAAGSTPTAAPSHPRAASRSARRSRRARRARRPGPACRGDAGELASPRLLTHMPWWSRLTSATARSGRPGRARPRSAGRRGRRPSPSRHPGSSRGRGARRRRRRRGRGRRRGRPGAPLRSQRQPFEPALHRVDVRVGEARQQQGPVAVDDRRADRASDADRRDPPVDDHDVADPSEVGDAVEDRCVAEDRRAHACSPSPDPGQPRACVPPMRRRG